MGGYTKPIIIQERPKDKVNTLHVDFSTRRITSLLTAYRFKDHDYHIHFVPALNLSAYGKTDEEARIMLLHIVMPDFYDNLMNQSPAAAFEYLSKLGWQAKGREAEDFENAAYVDKDGVLRNFNLPEDTIIEEQLLTV